MKIIINSGQANLNRFCEVLAAAKIQGLNFRAYIANLPDVYRCEYEAILPAITNIEDAHFYNKYPKEFSFDNLFRHAESILDIQKRINAAVMPETINLCASSTALLKTATERLSLTVDQINNIIGLAWVIAGLELADTIQPQHTAEAIQYTIKPDENE
jgi:hypothetical protein